MTAVNFCSGCGRALAADDRFCPGCGKARPSETGMVITKVAEHLTPEEQADVAAETPGRVTGSPIERGTRVEKGAELIRLSAVETEASLREAEANALQIEARLALDSSGRFDINKVPEVANAKANLGLAEAEFGRIETLLQPVRPLLLAQWLPGVLMVGAEGVVVPYADGVGGGSAAGALLRLCRDLLPER